MINITFFSQFIVLFTFLRKRYFDLLGTQLIITPFSRILKGNFMFEQIMNVFVSNAHADTAAPMAAGAQGGGMSFVMMFVIFFLFIYFAVWRPQSKRAKEQQSLMTSLTKGDEVMTAGGMLGRITKLTDQYIGLAIANNVEILIQKSSVVTVLPKGTLKSID
jgi:preprotein translocase subunit YajC